MLDGRIHGGLEVSISVSAYQLSLWNYQLQDDGLQGTLFNDQFLKNEKLKPTLSTDCWINEGRNQRFPGRAGHFPMIDAQLS